MLRQGTRKRHRRTPTNRRNAGALGCKGSRYKRRRLPWHVPFEGEMAQMDALALEAAEEVFGHGGVVHRDRLAGHALPDAEAGMTVKRRRRPRRGRSGR